MPDSFTTFPLPEDVIRREKLRALFTSPLIWIPQILTLLAGLWLKWPWWGIVLAMLGVFLVCALIWQARSPKLSKKITKRIIKESNEGQDSELLKKVREFEKEGHDGYAVTLGKFVQLKREIEKELHSGVEELGEEAKEVERMVDSLCFGMVAQFENASEIERQLVSLSASESSERKLKLTAERKEILGRVIEGYKSLRNTKKQLVYLVKPAAKGRSGKAVDIDSIIHQLKSEDEIAKRTRSRMDDDLL